MNSEGSHTSDKSSDKSSDMSHTSSDPPIRFVSLGFNCNPAMCLKDLGLKRETQVFDWLVTTPEMIKSLLSNRFKDFADMNHWSTCGMLFDERIQKFLLPGRKSKFYHKIYETIFIHDGNPTVAVQEKYSRRAARFLNLLESEKPVLFIFGGKPKEIANKRNDHTIIGLPVTYGHEDYMSQLRDLKNFIVEKFPTLPFHILGFNVDFRRKFYEEDNLTTWTLGTFRDRPFLERRMTPMMKKLLVDRHRYSHFPLLNKFLDKYE